MSLYSMEEICEGCIHGVWHRCCGTFCHCEGQCQDDDTGISFTSGTCDFKEVKENV